MRDFQRYRWFFKMSYGLAAIGEIKIKGFSFNKVFSLQIHLFASVAVVNAVRREGPKSCGDCSEQTNHWNLDPSVTGKRHNYTLSINGI